MWPALPATTQPLSRCHEQHLERHLGIATVTGSPQLSNPGPYCLIETNVLQTSTLICFSQDKQFSSRMLFPQQLGPSMSSTGFPTFTVTKVVLSMFTHRSQPFGQALSRSSLWENPVMVGCPELAPALKTHWPTCATWIGTKIIHWHCQIIHIVYYLGQARAVKSSYVVPTSPCSCWTPTVGPAQAECHTQPSSRMLPHRKTGLLCSALCLAGGPLQTTRETLPKASGHHSTLGYLG